MYIKMLIFADSLFVESVTVKFRKAEFNLQMQQNSD